MQFILGVIVGIVIMSAGITFTDIGQLADRGASAITGTVKEVVQ